MGRKARVATLEGLAELMTLREAAEAVAMSVPTLRTAINRGELVAFIPRGKDPIHAGPGQGYRITRESLRAWYFGSEGGQ